MTDISKKIDTYNGFVNGCDEYFNYISCQYPYDFGYLKDRNNLYNAWFANFVLFFAVFIENYMILLEDEKYSKCFNSISGMTLRDKKDNLRKLRNYLMHGSFYFQYEKSLDAPNVVLTDNEGEKVISFNSISNLYNEIVSVVFRLNSNKTGQEKAENCRLEYALFNNMNKISGLIGNNVFIDYVEYNPGYSYYHNDMVTAAILVKFYAVYNYGLETIFGPNVETVNEEQDFLQRVIENEYVDFTDFNFDLMDVRISKDVSVVRSIFSQRNGLVESSLLGIVTSVSDENTSCYIAENFDYLYGNDINKIIRVCGYSVNEMIKNLIEKIKRLNSFFKEKYDQYVDNFNTLFHLRNSYSHARIKITDIEQDSGNILFVDRRGKKKTFEALISPWDFLDSMGYDNRRILDNYIENSVVNFKS